MGLFDASQKQRDEFFELFPTEESYYDTEDDFATLLSWFQEASRSKGYTKDSPKSKALMDIYRSAGSPNINVINTKSMLTQQEAEAGKTGWTYPMLEESWDRLGKRRSDRGGRANYKAEGKDWKNQILKWKKNWFGKGKGKILSTHQRGVVNVPLFPMKEEWMGKDIVDDWKETDPEFAEKNIIKDPTSFFPLDENNTIEDRWVNASQMNNRIAQSFLHELSHGIQEADLTDEEAESQDTQIRKQWRKHGDAKSRTDMGIYGVQGTHENEAMVDIQGALSWLLDNPSYYDYQNKPGVSEIK